MSATRTNTKKPVAFGLVVLAAVALPWFGPGPLLAAAILASALLGAPLFALVGIVTILCYVLWGGVDELIQLRPLIERIRTLADNDTLLAIPLFMMSGAIMARGEISSRLIDFAKSAVGWLPGGLAMSGVLACMLFASISGSSPATVVAIGAMMVPSLLKHGYEERFSQGLLTASGSLGILIPPSIPMVVFPIVFTSATIQVERLFAAGVGPGLLIGGLLMAYCFYRGIRDGAERQPFEARALGRALIDGIWSLLFPITILGGISQGLFNAVEAAAISVVYAIVVEVWIHGALELKQIPKIFQETGIFLGSLLVIMVAALAFSEFLESQSIPQMTVDWIRSLDLSPLAFLLILNLLLLAAGSVMEILSAMFVFVPLLGPVAVAMGIDPIHFAIIFIVNLEIGYLTPPVGLNLFVASTLFNRPLGHMIRAVVPFIGVMLIGLVIVTYVPAVSVGFGDWLMGIDEPSASAAPAPLDREPDERSSEPLAPESPPGGGVQTLEEMMRELERGEPTEDTPESELTPAERSNPGRVLTLEEMMEASDLE